MAAAAGAEGSVFCPTCKAEVDDVEEIGGSLICAACGAVLDDGSAQLVHTRAAPRGPDDAPGEGFGVRVRDDDTGALAGAILHASQRASGALAALAPGAGGAGGGAAARTVAVDQRAHLRALSAGVAAAQLPQGAARDAAELLPAVARACAAAGRHIMPATVAATAYLAARNANHAASLRDVAAGFGVSAAAVGRHYMSLLKLLQAKPPPPRLEALVLRHAAILLPRTFPEHAGQPLASHPVVRSARDIAALMARLDALSGRAPALAAAAALALAFAARGGARPATAAADVAALLGFDRHSVQQSVRHFEAELAKLGPLLPFVGADAPAALLVPYAPLLLRLDAVVSRAAAAAGAAAASAGGGNA